MMGIPAITQPKVLIKPSANGYDSKRPGGGEPGPGGWVPGSPAVVSSSSGGAEQGSTGVITGENFSSLRQEPLYFTDFEGGDIGSSVIAGEEILSGDIGTDQRMYVYSNASPLTGSLVARANPMAEKFGDIYVATDSDELFFEFFSRCEKLVWVPTNGEPPQIKYARMSHIDHGARPYVGITHQDGDKGSPSLVYDYGAAPYVGFPGSNTFPEGEWIRETFYYKISDIDVANGCVSVRSSYANQWRYSGADFFSTPNDWDEPPRVTRSGTAAAAFKAMRFPFYQRSAQSALVDINHIIGNDTRERVILSTSPVWTASIEHKHVSCPTTSRSASQVSYKSMIGCLPAGSAVYAYVVNADGGHNINGILVRAAA